MKQKQWLKLGLVATALLLIPRRSSQKSQVVLTPKPNKQPAKMLKKQADEGASQAPEPDAAKS